MRDPKRIDKFCEELAEQWKKVPDWRFGQFISNVMGAVWEKYGDIFFHEEENMMGYIKEAVSGFGSSHEEKTDNT